MQSVRADLRELERILRDLGLWESAAPAPEALASRQPFAVDTLQFNQWLQFVFIPRMHALLDAEQTLPGPCGIAPMAEEFVKHVTSITRGQGDQLIQHLKQLDERLS